MNFRNVIVKKPWGSEYLLFQNRQVAIWRLDIEAGKETSLHSHPNKKTGIIVVGGKAEISFLDGSLTCEPLSKLMIHPGVFHKTKAIDGDVILMETETPTDKTDLLRLTDEYGRAGRPYEDDHSFKERDLINMPMMSFQGSVIEHLGDCRVLLNILSPASALLHGPDIQNDVLPRVFIFLNGGMVSEKGIFSVRPGDVVWLRHLIRLISISHPIPRTEVAEIWKKDD